MKRRLATTIGVGALFFSHLAYAGSGWTDYVTAAELVPTARHYYEVRLQVKRNPSACSEKTWFYQDYDSPGSDMMFKTLLEAIKSGIRMRVYVTGKCNLNGYSEISSVSIIP